MENDSYRLVVSADNAGMASRDAQDLSDRLCQLDGVIEAHRQKSTEDTMDLGAVVVAVCASQAALAVAKGVASWLQARRGAKVTIERVTTAGSIKAIVNGLDPHAAARIVEIVLGSSIEEA